MHKHLFYFTFDQIHKKCEYNRFAIIATDQTHALEQATKIGTNPVVDAGPYQLNKDWK